MAVNRSRDMVAELHQGIIDSTYIQLHPNQVGNTTTAAERMSWPTYARAEQKPEHPFAQHPYFLADYDEVHTSGTPTTRSRY